MSLADNKYRRPLNTKDSNLTYCVGGSTNNLCRTPSTNTCTVNTGFSVAGFGASMSVSGPCGSGNMNQSNVSQSVTLYTPISSHTWAKSNITG